MGFDEAWGCAIGGGWLWSDVGGGILGGWWWLWWICGSDLAEEVCGGYGKRERERERERESCLDFGLIGLGMV